MINFLHTFEPNSSLFSYGFLTVHYYGLFIVMGMIAGFFLALRLAKYYKIDQNDLFDLFFYLVIGGIIGARIYHVFLELGYYISNPLDIFKIWNGGLAIHGGIIAGLIILYWFSKKRQINFWLLGSLIVPGLALAQAFGRWGNYFNQELFGLPTDLPWGIPISLINRPLEYLSSEYFHPTFLYESIGNFLIFIILILIHTWIIRKKKFKIQRYELCVMSYAILYSILRFSLEFIRIDPTPVFLGLRFPQIASIIIVIISVIILLLPKLKKGVNIK